MLASTGMGGMLGFLQKTAWSMSTMDTGIATGLVADAPSITQGRLHKLMRRYTEVGAVWDPAMRSVHARLALSTMRYNAWVVI